MRHGVVQDFVENDVFLLAAMDNMEVARNFPPFASPSLVQHAWSPLHLAWVKMVDALATTAPGRSYLCDASGGAGADASKRSVVLPYLYQLCIYHHEPDHQQFYVPKDDETWIEPLLPKDLEMPPAIRRYALSALRKLSLRFVMLKENPLIRASETHVI